MSLGQSVVSKVHHVAREVALDGFGLGQELERLSFAEEAMEEDNMLVSVLTFNYVYVELDWPGGKGWGHECR